MPPLPRLKSKAPGAVTKPPDDEDDELVDVATEFEEELEDNDAPPLEEADDDPALEEDSEDENAVDDEELAALETPAVVSVDDADKLLPELDVEPDELEDEEGFPASGGATPQSNVPGGRDELWQMPSSQSQWISPSPQSTSDLQDAMKGFEQSAPSPASATTAIQSLRNIMNGLYHPWPTRGRWDNPTSGPVPKPAVQDPTHRH